MSSDFAAPMDYAGALERSGEGRRPMDEREFQILYAQTCRALRAYLLGVTRDTGAAEDLLQETYYRYLKAPNTPEDIDARRGYLFRIAFNLVRDQARAAGRNREIQTDARETGTSDVDVGLRADLREALEGLDPKDRMRLWLAYVNGSSHREIAAATGVGETSVGPLLLRARRRLAEVLRRRGFGLERLPKGTR